MAEDLKGVIAASLGPFLTEMGFELVDLKLARYGRSSRLQVFIDSVSDRGVTIADCGRVSRGLDGLVEGAGWFSAFYTVEVSSPGIDRPFTSEKGFKRRVGRTVEIEFMDSSRRPLRGAVVAVDAGVVCLSAQGGQESVSLADVKVAREVI